MAATGERLGVCGPIFLAQLLGRSFPIRTVQYGQACLITATSPTFTVPGIQWVLNEGYDWKGDSTYHACHSREQNAWDEVDDFLFCPSLTHSLTVE